MEKSVTLKGTNEGYYLFLDDTSSLTKVFQDLEELFDQIKKDDRYEQEFELTIDTGNRLLDEEKKESLSNLITEHTNFAVKKFEEHVLKKDLANEWHKQTSPLMVVKNIRNGQIVRSERDIILFGDVRPGAVVRSTGSIIVIGDVQGTMHAGAKGAEEAIIIAPFSYNGQVRIGDHIEIIEAKEAKLSEDDENTKNRHQIVFLNDLHVIEFANANELGKIRPDFAKDLGGFEEWQKKL